MLAELNEIDALLDSVTAEQSAAGAQKLVDLDADPKRGPAVLYSCSASWNTRTDPKKAERPGPRHQTLRRRGKAPAYPRPIDLTRGTPGKLVMLREGLSLEPMDARKPCVHISASSIRRALFYRDCLEIIHGRADRTLVRCEAVDTLDLMFEAHY